MPAKKLTNDQIDARMAMYGEAAGHMKQAITDIPEERRSAVIVHRQICALASKFWHEHRQIYIERKRQYELDLHADNCASDLTGSNESTHIVDAIEAGPVSDKATEVKSSGLK